MNKINPLIATLVLTAGVLSHAQAQTPFTNGLVAYFPFDGTANDASGTGNNGSVHNATLAVDRFGRTNSCYQFNNSWIFVPYNPTLYPTNQTISIWFKNTGVYHNTALMRAGNIFDDDNRGYGINTVNDNIEFGAEDWNGLSIDAVLTTPVGQWPSNIWAQLVFTHAGNVAALYLNGQMIVSRTNVTPYQPVLFSPLYIGSGEVLGQNGATTLPTDPPSIFWNGFIDDVRIYNRALPLTEVQQLYDYESGPHVDLIKAVKPSFRNLTLTTNYQLQVSSDLINWTNQGSAFTATNLNMTYPQYFDVDNWNRLFFRLQVSP